MIVRIAVVERQVERMVTLLPEGYLLHSGFGLCFRPLYYRVSRKGFTCTKVDFHRHPWQYALEQTAGR